jgi:hypothetical protein
MTARMKALKSFNLRGNRINPGDVFAAKPKDVTMLTIAKLAEETDASETQKAGTPVSALGTADVAPRKSAASQAKPAAQAGQKDLSGMNVADLRAHAKELGIRSPTVLNKAELLSKIKGRYNRRDMRAR